MDSPFLYVIINALVISVPLILSFDKKVHFYTYWRSIIPAIVIVATGFLAWDVYFAHAGYWGFNERYLSGLAMFGLPLGEWLFFFTVPYACLFIYACLKAYVGTWIDRGKWAWFLYVLTIVSALILVLNFGKAYSVSASILALIILVWLRVKQPEYIHQLSFAFILCFIPFLLTNGILTGSFIEEQIVWYNADAFSGIRITTIPLEDFIYAFDLIGLNIILFEWLEKRRAQKEVVT